MDRGLELFISIHKDLAESKTWKPPRVFINPTVGPTLMQQLTESVKRHQVGGWGVYYVGRRSLVASRVPPDWLTCVLIIPTDTH